MLAAKSGSGGPAMPIAIPPGFRTRSDLASVFALGVQDYVVVVHDRLEVLRSGVDDDVGTKVADPFDVAGARRCRDGRHRMLNVWRGPAGFC